MPLTAAPDDPARVRAGSPRSRPGTRGEHLLDDRAPWLAAAALAVCVAVAAARRLPGLDSLGLSSDEAVYVGQGLGLAGDPSWAAVRAHPPLLGLLLELVPGGTTGEVGPRTVSVVLGLVAVVVAGLLGRELAGWAAGVLAAGAVAVMPYHADVTRQALVEVPMATLAAVGLLLVVRSARTGSDRLLEPAAVVLGVATLAKETALLTVAAVVLAVIGGDVPARRGTLLRAACWYLGVAALYPLYLAASGSWAVGSAYLGWQLERHGTSSFAFYSVHVLPRLGLLLVALALAGTGVLLRRRRRGGLVVALAVLVPVLFYALWPVSGYPYLLATVVPLAALAGAGAVAVVLAVRTRVRGVVAAVLASAALVMTAGTASAATPLLPGASGTPGVREAARWTAEVPDATVVTAAPWVANVVRYYRPDSTVVATTPATTEVGRLNPAYRDSVRHDLPPGPLVVLWDRWSSATDPAGTARLLREIRERGGRVAHVEPGPEGAPGAWVVCFVVGA
jgi:4-amino-4-deoxy-L-arabinose transferase-like glycosyltransferase